MPLPRLRFMDLAPLRVEQNASAHGGAWKAAAAAMATLRFILPSMQWEVGKSMDTDVLFWILDPPIRPNSFCVYVRKYVPYRFYSHVAWYLGPDPHRRDPLHDHEILPTRYRCALAGPLRLCNIVMGAKVWALKYGIPIRGSPGTRLELL